MRIIRSITILSVTFICTMCLQLKAQPPEIKLHPNNGMYALSKNDSLITDYIFSEISEFSENKAYAAKGELYGYIDTNGNELSPFIFVVANNFKNGFAVIGDSFSQGMINAKMQLVVPVRFYRLMSPKLGLIRIQNHDGYWGLYDTLGELKVHCAYDLPPQYNTREHIVVRKDLEYGVINDCNEILYNTNYQYISTDGIAYKSGLALRLFPDIDQLE